MDRHEERNRAQRTQKIRELNDRLRVTGTGGKIFLTRAVADLPPATVTRLLKAIGQFADFTRDNDPWGEHDFGQVMVDGTAYFWKIDAYDINMEFGSPDPADSAVTCRIMTVMTGHDL